jgi:hypothetical protein
MAKAKVLTTRSGKPVINEAKSMGGAKPTCTHNAMVPNDDPAHVWKCADCGYVYGKGGAK